LIKAGRSLWIILLLLIASLTAGFLPIASGNPIYFRLSILWGLMLITSYVWTVISLRGLIIKRYARTVRHQVGQIFEERIEIVNATRIPRLWVGIRDLSDLPGSMVSRVLTWIGSKRTRSYVAYTFLNQRGLFQLGPTEISSGDVFGIFRASRVVLTAQQLLVIPHLVNLSYFPSPQGLLPGGRALRRRTLEVSPYAASVREFAAGDPLNRIHWPSTARKDRLMVKEFEQDPQADVWIFVDAYQYVQAALPEEQNVVKEESLWLWRRPKEIKMPPATIEYAIGCAASIASYFIRQNQAVGFTSSGQVDITLSPERGERQQGKILEMLGLLKPEGKMSLLGLIGAQVPHMMKGSTVVLITPSVSSEILLGISELQQRSMQPVLVLINAVTFGGQKGSDELALKAVAMGTPEFTVSHQDALQNALSSAGDYRYGTTVQWWKSTS
jgi:uncharacterized protein (DUF58 family)